MIQIDGIKRQVYIKMTNIEKVHAVHHAAGGEIEYTYPSGQVSTVTLAVAGLGTKRIRVANLPPDELRAALTTYGKIVDIQTVKCSNNYRYAIDNGVRQVTILMTRHVPSLLMVAGYRVLLSYEGQPATCYGCGARGHLYYGCPVGHKSSQDRLTPAQQTYVKIVSGPTICTAHSPATESVNDEQDVLEQPTEPSLVRSDEQRDTEMTENESEMGKCVEKSTLQHCPPP
jgi:hypothetical protein